MALGNFLDRATGGLLSDITGATGARDANKVNLEEAKINREWQERMSNTAYQRAMQDMKQAGLNPILAYQQGGASVPSGAQGQVNAVASPLGEAAKMGLQAYTGINAANSQVQQAQTAKAQAESTVALQATQATNQIAQTEKTQAETTKTIDSISNQKKQRELMQAQLRLEKTKSAAAELANKGVSTLENLSQKMLQNTAKPKVDKKTLQYKKSWIEKLF